MAVINKYSLLTEEVIAPTTLGASDTVNINLANQAVLIVNNDTGGSVDINFTGDTATTYVCTGVGSIDLTVGKTFTIADGAEMKIPLNGNYKYWLGDGNVTVTGATGATAYVLAL